MCRFSLKGGIRESYEQAKIVLPGNFFRGFTLVEMLIVVLLVGIICATGLSVYSGVTKDAQIHTITDSLQTFFSACRHRAKLRGLPISIRIRNKTLVVENSSNPKLNIASYFSPDCMIMDGILMTASQTFNSSGHEIRAFSIPVTLPGQKIATISVRL